MSDDSKREKNSLDEFRSSELSEERKKIKKETIELSQKEVSELKEITDSDDEFLQAQEEEILKKKNNLAIERAKKKIDNEAPDKMLSARPSYGLISANVEIHTRQAYAFLLGRRETGDKPGITGLFKAASMIKIIEQADKTRCPFAMLKIRQLEKVMLDYDELYIKCYNDAKKAISGNRLKLKAFSSNRPAIQSMTFISSHAFKMADMLMRYDDLVRLVYPYYQTGLMDKQIFFDYISPIAKKLRHVFSVNNDYSFVGLEHIKNKDAIYHMALKKYKVDEEFIDNFVKDMNRTSNVFDD